MQGYLFIQATNNKNGSDTKDQRSYFDYVR